MLLTNDVKVTVLTLHGIRVDLAHIPTAVSLFYLLYVEVPGSVLAVSHADTVVLRYHVICYRQNRLRVDAQPSNLEAERKNNSDYHDRESKRRRGLDGI